MLDQAGALDTFVDANFNALSLAEAKYDFSIGHNDPESVAQAAAVQEFIDNGGTFISDAANPLDTTPLGLAIASAYKAEDSLNDAIFRATGMFHKFGFDHRQSFNALADDAALLTVLDRAIKDTDSITISDSHCYAGNRAVDGSGRDVPACFADFQINKVPSGLVMGGRTTNPAQLDADNQPITTSIGAMRTLLHVFHSENPTFVERIDAVLNRQTTASERESIVLAWEAAMLAHYDPLHNSAAGTDFASSGAYENENVLMSAQRSAEDSVASGSELNVNMVVGAAVLVVLYAALTMVNHRSSIFTHVGLMVWGVASICAAVAAGLGASAYADLSYSMLTTNVVPFAAFAIGMVLIFVVSRVYLRELANNSDAGTVIGNTLSTVLPSSLFCLVVTLTAVLIGSISEVPVLEDFCYQLALCILFSFIAVFMLYVPAVVIDCHRTLASRPDCGIKACTEDESNEPGFTDSFCISTFGPFLMHNAVRAVVIVVFVAWFAVSIWSGEI